jgi:hypothetical protein
VFVVCAVFALVAALINWSGPSGSPEMLLTVIGVAFKPENKTNFDFAIVISMIVAGTTLLFAVLMFARLEFVRWVLAVLGALITVYYIYDIIWILSHDGGRYIALALVAWLLWLAGTVLAILPATGRAMRHRQPGGPPGYPPAGPPGYPPPGYPQY